MFLLPFAALAMASCSSSEDSLVQPQPELNTELKIFPSVGTSTRGTVETTASLSSFQVIASGKFASSATSSTADVPSPAGPWEVTKSGSNWAFTGTNKLYWFDATTAGKFTAYANSSVSAADGKLAGVTVPATLADQKDVLVAYNEGTKTDFTTGVPLHFRHAMSQIVVKASYTFDASITGYDDKVIKVNGIKFFNLNNTGTLTLPTASTAAGEDYEPAWSGHTGAEGFEVTLTSPVTLGSPATSIDLSEAANPLLLLPQTTAATTNLKAATVTGAYLAVSVDINNSDGSDYYPTTAGYAWVAVPVSIEWKGGSKYIYTLNFTNGAFGRIAPGTDDDGADKVTPGEKKVGDALPDELLTPVNFLVTVEDEWTEYPLTPSF